QSPDARAEQLPVGIAIHAKRGQRLARIEEHEPAALGERADVDPFRFQPLTESVPMSLGGNDNDRLSGDDAAGEEVRDGFVEELLAFVELDDVLAARSDRNDVRAGFGYEHGSNLTSGVRTIHGNDAATGMSPIVHPE